VHVVGALFELKAGRPIYNLYFTKDAVHFWVIIVGLGRFECFFKCLGEKPVHTDHGLLLFKRQEQVVVFGAQFARLQLGHNLLVVTAFFFGALSEGRFPVAVRSRSQAKLVVVVEFRLKAKLANLNVLAYRTLILCVVNYIPLATSTVETTIVLLRRLLILLLLSNYARIVGTHSNFVLEDFPLQLLGFFSFFLSKFRSILVQNV
jgi:hypothetical protein